MTPRPGGGEEAVSRELDAKVAEVLGFRVCDRRFADWPRVLPPTEPADSLAWDRCPAYSTSGDGLLAMLEFHAKAGREVDLCWRRHEDEPWFCDLAEFSSDDSGRLAFSKCVTGPTPGAALAAATVAWYEGRNP